ncbi:helix-turn-helix transcriptional regulator [Mycolicibacterium hippocampi]|uniref:Transcriptional regulator n=1 Tax=Mycolicibacterium hippocampi TaxID=659824 RepID=A0A7I9ZVZ4_9MYCO|nr:helix-turn-helix transcriptional regulator [Mycolicibacterium hippocampi]GFH04999.1 transcriptional regulator [Mycolicibacterium hippocampi]
MTNNDRADFGEYLRHRRAQMAPPNPPGGARASQRRVPGLRRQELSDVAGISVEYYTRLEQGRSPRPSREILGALARAFELSDVERAHLFRLAGELPPEPDAPGTEVRPGLLRLMRSLGDTTPITVHDGRLDLLAHNAAAAELFGPLSAGGTYGRNIVYQCFMAGPLRDVLGEDGIDQLASEATAQLRSALSRYPDDEYLHALLGELSATSPAFRAQWERGEVGARRSAVKRLRHPTPWLADFRQ